MSLALSIDVTNCTPFEKVSRFSDDTSYILILIANNTTINTANSIGKKLKKSNVNGRE